MNYLSYLLPFSVDSLTPDIGKLRKHQGELGRVQKSMHGYPYHFKDSELDPSDSGVVSFILHLFRNELRDEKAGRGWAGVMVEGLDFMGPAI